MEIRRLFIGEKPSQARDLADYLGVVRRGNGFFECKNNDVVTYCVGHMKEAATPEHYDPQLKSWNISTLPIIPQPGKWIYLVKEKTAPQLKVIGELMKLAKTVVNFGDPDNEGQVLVDDVLDHFCCKVPVLRLWLQALDPEAIAAGLNNLQPNSNFSGMRDAGRARGKADWLVGMNFSRAYTLNARAKGGEGVLPVGRVQTPTLALVADRCRAVQNFVPIPYLTVHAKVAVANGILKMLWQPSENQPGLDTEGRLVDRAVADSLAMRLQGVEGAIDTSQTKPMVSQPPLPFSLLSLTVAASKAFGYKSAQVLDGCQALYEKYKITSYPRTDCGYLPESQHKDAPDILDALANNIPGVAGALQFTDVSIKSKAWNDEKITAHFGIIPRPVKIDFAILPELEANLYQLIARSYLAQFFPLHEFLETKVSAVIDGETFKASGRVITMPGWKVLYNDEEDEKNPELPSTISGEAATALEIIREQKKTKPPSLFDEASLQEALENVHKFLSDAEERKAMANAEGIGTPATRAAIIEELKNRGLLVEELRGKRTCLIASQSAFSLLDDLPEIIKSPVMAAQWEKKLRAIESGNLSMDEFVAEQSAFITAQIALIRKNMPIPVVHDCPDCKGGELRRIRYKNNYFWGCSNYKTGCRSTFPDVENKPYIQQ